MSQLSRSLQIIIICLLGYSSVILGEDEPGEFRWSGFATIGVTDSGNDVIGFRRDNSRYGNFGDLDYKTDSLIGFQANYQISDKFSTAAQFVYKSRPENNLEHSLEWLYLQYSYSDDLAIRAGRLGTDLFMLSEYRNIGFAYDWVRPPIEFYGSLALDSFDGFDVSYTDHLHESLMRYKFFSGQSKQTFPSVVGDSENDFEDIIGFSVAWEDEHWTVRSVIQNTTFGNNLSTFEPLTAALLSIPSFVWPELSELASDLESKGREMRFYSLGISYDKTPWKVQSEVGYISSGYEAAFPDLLSAYFSVGRRFELFTLYGIVAKAESDDAMAPPPEPSGGNNTALVGLFFGIQQYTQQIEKNQRSVSLGLRFDVATNVAFKIQWDRNWIDPYGAALWDLRGTNPNSELIDTVSINLDFVF